MMGMLSYSCMDKTYDLEKLSTKMELFGQSMAIPIGKTTIYLDTIINGLDVDSSILQVENGVYVFHYSGSMDMSGLTNELSGFNLDPLSGVSGSVDMYDARSVPPAAIPFPIPPMLYTYNGSATINLPDFSTDLIAVDSVVLKNTTMHISFSNSGLGGSKLSESISVTFTAQGDGAVYYVDGAPATTWTIGMNETKTVEIRKLRLAGNSNLTLLQTVNMNIEQAGDVTAEAPIQTTLNHNITMSPIDFDVVYGKVNYQLANTALDPISFDALGDLLGSNDVLSFYNPTIKINTSGNLGVPVDITLNMSSSNSLTGASSSLTNTTLHMEPASTPGETKVNQFVIDRNNGTSDLFKINPDNIDLSYSVQTVTNTPYNHFIAKNSQLYMDYTMEIPLQFDSDLQLNIGQTMDSPVGDLSIQDDQDDLVLGLTLKVENHIPLALQLSLTALDENGTALFTTTSGTIGAAQVDLLSGKAIAATTTNTSIDLTPVQINKLKDTKQFEVNFVITAGNQANFVSVQPSDYIDIKVGLQTQGGLVIDPSNTSNNK